MENSLGCVLNFLDLLFWILYIMSKCFQKYYLRVEVNNWIFEKYCEIIEGKGKRRYKLNNRLREGLYDEVIFIL